MNECLRKDGHAKLADSLSIIINKKSMPEAKKGLNMPKFLPPITYYRKYTGEFLLSLDEDEVARQLSLIEMDTYRSIEPIELLNQAWNKPSLRYRASHVLRMISRFNAISNWVAHIILNEERLKGRAKVTSKIIKIAQALHRCCNFNSLLAVMAGLNNSAVHRLRFTFEEISSKDLEIMKTFGELMSSDKGYKNYRSAIHNVNPPLIPYLGVYLTDLTFIEDGNPDRVPDKPDGLINFRKRDMIYDVILEIQQYQHMQYKYEPVDSIIAYLSEIPIIEDTKAMDSELYDISLQREPRSCVKGDIVQ